MARRPFAVLDRDGTLIVDRHYLTDPGQVQLLPGAAAGVAKLRALGLGVVVLTNQSAIGRGLLDEPTLAAIHDRLRSLLAAQDLGLDGIYHCPHVPEAGCGCRKPRTGLLDRAACDLEIDLEASFVIGDKACDVELGQAVGATTILVRTGNGSRLEENARVRADDVVDDLEAAAGLVARLIGRGLR
jgi:D-glycero-D-manno-heptose 1,7-bisphosphate phosphatase